jgi:hypothetical protein
VRVYAYIYPHYHRKGGRMDTQQVDALNRAVAEHDGWKYHGSINGRHVWMEREDTACEPPDYTRDLNAIVAVAQRWTDSDRVQNTFRLHECLVNADYEFRVHSITDLIRHKQPALALCLAFAKAAGLKGDWAEQDERAAYELMPHMREKTEVDKPDIPIPRPHELRGLYKEENQ